jgi:hypothetical protein
MAGRSYKHIAHKQWMPLQTNIYNINNIILAALHYNHIHAPFKQPNQQNQQ